MTSFFKVTELSNVALIWAEEQHYNGITDEPMLDSVTLLDRSYFIKFILPYLKKKKLQLETDKQLLS